MDISASPRYTKTVTLTASDTVPVNGGHGTKGVFALTSGNVDVLFQEDQPSLKRTIPMVAGVIYPFSLRMFYSSSVGTLLGLL